MLTMNLDRPTVKIAGAAILASLAVIMQILPPIFVSPWSMRIDLVAIPWILCWIIFGFKPALLSILISAPLIGFVGPLAGGWVGATMKSVASIWMFVIPGIIAWKTGGTKHLLENKRLFVVASIMAIIVRVGVTVIFNFYFALPFFFYMTPDDIIGFFSGVTIFGLTGLGAYIGEVAIWNTIQAIIDLTASLSIGLIILQRLPGLATKPKKK
jgi:riboflavin transporter FmnP